MRRNSVARRTILWMATIAIIVAIHCYNTKITSALTTRTTPAPVIRTIPFQNFKFAPNSVCVSPQYFVERREDSENDKNANGTGRMQNYDYFTMRNVPGDGDCMFLAVALAAATSMGLGGSNELLEAISRQTRYVVAQVLSSPTGKVFIGPGKDNVVDASRLLRSAVLQEPTTNTTEEYIEALKKGGCEGGLYGGGPELVVLSNVLRRPISIYEADENQLRKQQQQQQQQRNSNTTNSASSPEIFFPIVCKGKFGEGVFEDPHLTSIPDSVMLANIQPGAYSWRLHILILNSSPTEKHACVLLPQQIHS
mmetsp:Transcript_43500/g.90557  ORF Transcript_43500/g.90557 Transcript_43500/m.90557 type:complete len:309 (+) Transcript_43500:112-1038(+)